MFTPGNKTAFLYAANKASSDALRLLLHIRTFWNFTQPLFLGMIV